jgi:leucyl/phenylalanyl-tRNA--protein transferase
MPVAILTSELRFPDPRTAMADGLVAVGGDLSVERLLQAYGSGIFPWTAQPLTWWSPDPRGIFDIGGMHISRSLARTLRKCPYEITRDKAFREVMLACAAPAQGRRSTWITPEFIDAYCALHRNCHAHSFECWSNGNLVGGIYGVALGGLFAGESMFHSAPDASKIALYHLHQHLESRGFLLFDIQMLTPITTQLGAFEISRGEYLKRLKAAVAGDSRF